MSWEPARLGSGMLHERRSCSVIDLFTLDNREFDFVEADLTELSLLLSLIRAANRTEASVAFRALASQNNKIPNCSLRLLLYSEHIVKLSAR